MSTTILNKKAYLALKAKMSELKPALRANYLSNEVKQTLKVQFEIWNKLIKESGFENKTDAYILRQIEECNDIISNSENEEV